MNPRLLPARATVLQLVLNEIPWWPVLVALMLVAVRSESETASMPLSEEVHGGCTA